MGLSKKDNHIFLSKSDLALLSLIKEGILGPCRHLMNKSEIDEVLRTQSFQGVPMPYTFSFSPDMNLSNARKNDEFVLMCGSEEVGRFFLQEKFQYKGDIQSIFNPNFCFVDETQRFYISGDFELFSSQIADTNKEFQKVKAHLNAGRITALISSLDPLHRAHERIFRWTIDKADLVVIFVIESCEKDGLEFELKLACLEKLIELYLPKDRFFIFPLKDLDIFHAHLNVLLEAIIAKNLGCTKFVLGQNHSGLGTFYEHNQPHTILDKFSKKFDIEIVALPEFVYCNKCKISVSVRSCPHGSHHHIKFHSNSLKKLLQAGIIPPTVFMRREISAMILSKLFPNRFAKIQNIYNDLFPSTGIVSEYKRDEDFYEQLLHMYQIAYMV